MNRDLFRLAMGGRAAHNVLLLASAIFCALGASASAEAKPTYTTIDVPGSAWTSATSINDEGVITGSYPCGGAVVGSYLRATDGTFTTFSLYSCTGDAANETGAGSINNRGAVTGSIRAGNTYGGFLRKPNGKIETISIAPYLTGDGETLSESINDKGVITGSFSDAGPIPNQGFVLAPGGKVTIFTPQGSIATYALCINNTGTITGYYTDNNGVEHGFVRTAGGTITSIDPQGSIGTRAVAINGKGVITGYYNDSGEIEHGFVRAADGTITTFIAFGTTQMTPMSINSKGEITGSYTDNTFHGFVRTPDGTITSFDPPGSILTYPLSINDKGMITGYFDDSSNKEHGFLRTK